MVTRYLPPAALEVGPDGQVYPVEAPPCGERLIIPDRNINLTCDRPAGHTTGPQACRHRQILQLSPVHAVGWCDDACSRPCEPLRAWLDMLRDQGLTIIQGGKR